MARRSHRRQNWRLWLYELSPSSSRLFNWRTELLSVLSGFCFYQLSISLLHSSVTSASVVFILANQWMMSTPIKMFEHSMLVNSTWPRAYPALCFSFRYNGICYITDDTVVLFLPSYCII